MGFNKVYKSLQEIFPQIDARVLRAVAIEHSKDADAAVEAVLSEIIPFFTERSRPSIPLAGSIAIGESLEGATATTQTADGASVSAVGTTDGQNGYIMNVGNQQSSHDANDIDGHSGPVFDTYDGHHEEEGNTADLALPENILGNSMKTNIDVYSDGEAVQLNNKDEVNAIRIEAPGDLKTDETISDDKYPESSIEIVPDSIPCHTLRTPQDEDNGTNQNLNVLQERADRGQSETEFGAAINNESDQGESYGDYNNSAVRPSSLTVHDPTSSPLESNTPLVVLQNMYGSDSVELDVSLPHNTASNMENASNIGGNKDEATLNVSISQSSQMNITDVLEEIIADARNNKQKLFSAMETVISLMREVELKEQAAEQAKVEAAMGGTDILAKFEELKQMLQQAEEANAMHAGEVYGEKAILATELRELQSRVLSLSDERDKSLAVLDEMRRTLEVRFAEAQNEIKSAEQEKIEKEKAALKALADQELDMEKVVKQSKILEQQAEENSKLREFLVDRGRVVDMLQGEIAVICQDVRLLKENFDEHVPFSKSLSSSQTSCILASSSSSSKSLVTEQVELIPDRGADSLETQDKTGVISRFTEQSSEEEAARDDRKALLDDGWELFDNRDIYS